jgi:ArsR family transcriptional regulator
MEAPVLTAVARLFKVLSDESRLRVIEALALGKEMCVSEISEHLGLSMTSVSHHLGILESMGFVAHQQKGQHVYHMISDDCLMDVLMRARNHVSGV